MALAIYQYSSNCSVGYKPKHWSSCPVILLEFSKTWLWSCWHHSHTLGLYTLLSWSLVTLSIQYRILQSIGCMVQHQLATIYLQYSLLFASIYAITSLNVQVKNKKGLVDYVMFWWCIDDVWTLFGTCFQISTYSLTNFLYSIYRQCHFGQFVLEIARFWVMAFWHLKMWYFLKSIVDWMWPFAYSLS